MIEAILRARGTPTAASDACQPRQRAASSLRPARRRTQPPRHSHPLTCRLGAPQRQRHRQQHAGGLHRHLQRGSTRPGASERLGDLRDAPNLAQQAAPPCPCAPVGHTGSGQTVIRLGPEAERKSGCLGDASSQSMLTQAGTAPRRSPSTNTHTCSTRHRHWDVVCTRAAPQEHA